MKLLRLDDPQVFDLAARWLSLEENYRWLDFGSGVQKVSPVSLKVMAQRNIHELRVFTASDDTTPIGVVGLSNIDRRFRTGEPWCVLGDKSRAGKRNTTMAVAMILELGFGELGLCSAFAWTLEINTPAIRLMERLNFRYVGRRRRCHYIDGVAYDRLLYDVLPEELQAPAPGRNTAAAEPASAPAGGR
jgi:RimJ/RimL family protein N-acetyltransferase